MPDPKIPLFRTIRQNFRVNNIRFSEIVERALTNWNDYSTKRVTFSERDRTNRFTECIRRVPVEANTYKYFFSYLYEDTGLDVQRDWSNKKYYVCKHASNWMVLKIWWKATWKNIRACEGLVSKGLLILYYVLLYGPEWGVGLGEEVPFVFEMEKKYGVKCWGFFASYYSC